MRLIDADKLLDILKGMHGIERTRYDDGLDVAEAVVDVAETIDSVKHGHWIRHLAIGWSEAHYTCSCCGYYLHFDKRKNANYCQNCGARLDEDEQYYKY